jgi:outer membrane receptor protein involved in Fe transport
MKPSLSLKALLLATSWLFWPALALAQTTAPAEEPKPASSAATDDAQEAAELPPEADAVEDDTEMSDDGVTETVVRGRFIPVPMRETSEVTTFLSSEDLARQGDDTAAAALTRLAGLSVVSGRFVFVRGLGDRYSSALLNGSPLPSPEPLRRTVPLDLFPSNVLDGAAVQKTYSPNFPGEFGGGVIDLKTVRLPNETYFNAKFSGGFNTATTGKDGLTYFGGERDWLGYDDGTRDIPGPLAQAIGRPARLDQQGLTPAQLEQIGESLVNAPLTLIQREEVDPNWEAELSGGASIDAGKYNIGLVGVAGYDYAWRTERATRQLGTSAIPLGFDQDSTTTALEVTINALGSASIGWDANEISVTGLYVHSTSKEAQIQSGFDFNTPANEAGQNLGASEATAFYERELMTLQLAGEHEFGPFALDWRGALAQSTRDAPYERSVNFTVDSSGRQLFSRSNNNATRFSELTDEVASFGVDGRYTIAINEQREAVFSAGYAYSNTVRDYELYRFLFSNTGALPLDVQRARIDFLFSPDNIDPRRFTLVELTGTDDSYKGGLRVNAAYVGADAELTNFIRAAVGVRFEDGVQSVRTFNRFGSPSVPRVFIEEQYYLPAGTITWNFADDLQLRLGASKTIARPQFRELSYSPYIDPDTDRSYRGNPFLQDSELTNYDARLEYYFDRNEFITIGAFYKEIDKPIEEVQYETSTLNFETSFINAPRALIYGAEFDYRVNFESPLKIDFLADRVLFFSANYTYTFSEVQAERGDVVFDALNLGVRRPASDYALDGSQLQGTPENIVNTQFGWESGNEQLSFLVGWVDQRILQRGVVGLGDVIEDPGVQLDVVYRRTFSVGGSELTLGVSGRNLLDEKHVETLNTPRGELDFNSFDRGQSFSVSLTSKF